MKKKTAFVSGVTGQDGAYLARLLINNGIDVIGGTRRSSIGIPHRLNELGVLDQIQMVDFDLSDIANITRAVIDHKPDYFFNLAAQSFVGSSWNFPVYTSNVDGMGVLYILEALRNHSPDTRFYQASTSEMFGLAQTVPQSEETPFYPRSPYGVAKLFSHWMTKNYRESYGMFAVSGILFNHESPLRGSEFVTRKITLAFAEILEGKKETISLGNLEATRDWGYAEEYVQGMYNMLTAEKPDDYVLATGTTYSIREFVNFTANAAGIEIEWDLSLIHI